MGCCIKSPNAVQSVNRVTFCNILLKKSKQTSVSIKKNPYLCLIIRKHQDSHRIRLFFLVKIHTIYSGTISTVQHSYEVLITTPRKSNCVNQQSSIIQNAFEHHYCWRWNWWSLHKCGTAASRPLREGGITPEKKKGRLLTGINSGFRKIPIRRRGWCSPSSHSEWRTGTITPRV